MRGSFEVIWPRFSSGTGDVTLVESTEVTNQEIHESIRAYFGGGGLNNHTSVHVKFSSPSLLKTLEISQHGNPIDYEDAEGPSPRKPCNRTEGSALKCKRQNTRLNVNVLKMKTIVNVYVV